MHFDLRIEMGGTLASFAVPRGPSLDPADKRLAVQTENHPIEYLDFEDVIPEGNYGAGPMIVWDIGRVQYLEANAEAGERDGKIDFVLSGQKLKGRFALVLTGKGKDSEERAQRQWLLLKKPDEHSRAGEQEITERQPHSVLSGLTITELGQRAEIAAALIEEARALGAPTGNVNTPELVPMLCSTKGGELQQAGRLYELKLDGVRIIADKHDDNVSLRYRSLRPAAANYPEVVRAVRTLAPQRLVLDGEIVTFDERGRPSFQRLAPRIHARQPQDIQQARIGVPVNYVVFDLLQLGPYDLRGLPLLERKRLLRKLLPGRGVIWVLDHALNDGRPLFDWCQRQGLEGVVSKLAAGPYRPGPVRTQDWIKLKCGHEDEFVVVGWLSGKGSRERLGALELGTWDGERWVYRGRVGSGLSDSAIDDLLRRLQPLRRADDPAVGEPMPYQGERFFVEPQVVVRASYLEWTPDERLRMAVFIGVREDIDPKSCRAAPPQHDPETPEEERALAAAPRAEAAAPRTASATPASGGSGAVGSGAVRSGAGSPSALPSRVALTNLDKIFWPDDGFTKGDLIAYYAAISDTLLPHLRDRPVMLVRYPDGITGKNFYQWNVPKGTPDWLQTLVLRDEERDGKNVATFLVDSADALMHIANLGCIPLHVLACRRQTLEHCDFLTIDFDLGEQPLHQGVRLALSLREILGELELPGYPKTSGQSGLHVLIPLGPGISFDTAKALVELIGRVLQLRHSDVATMERRVSERRGRVYIDTGQTGRSRTIVAPYSVRAYPGASVSTPLYWEEVHMALDPRLLTMFTVPGRAADRGDPMEGMLRETPDIPKAVARLGKLLEPLRR